MTVIVNGILFAVIIALIYASVHFHKEKRNVVAAIIFLVNGVICFIFINNVTNMKQGKYSTELPETNKIYRTTSCVQNQYFSYFTAIKKGRIEPRYFRKKGGCPPPIFSVNKKGEYRAIHLTRLPPIKIPYSSKSDNIVPRI